MNLSIKANLEHCLAEPEQGNIEQYILIFFRRSISSGTLEAEVSFIQPDHKQFKFSDVHEELKIYLDLYELSKLTFQVTCFLVKISDPVLKIQKECIRVYENCNCLIALIKFLWTAFNFLLFQHILLYFDILQG